MIRECNMSVQASNDGLMHYGVVGMKWGVRRDNRLRNKVDKYSTISLENAWKAEEEAAKRANGSKYLERSNRYMKKATKAANKMPDGGKSFRETNGYKLMVNTNKAAAKNYVERSFGERAASVAKSAAVSTGISFVAMAYGSPIGYLSINPGPKYKLKNRGETK